MKPRSRMFGNQGGIGAPVHSLRVYYRQGAGRNGRYHACPDCTNPPMSFDKMLEEMARERRIRAHGVPYTGTNMHGPEEELRDRRKAKARTERKAQSKERR